MRNITFKKIRKIFLGESKIDSIRGFVSHVKNKDAVRMYAVADHNFPKMHEYFSSNYIRHGKIFGDTFYLLADKLTEERYRVDFDIFCHDSVIRFIDRNVIQLTVSGIKPRDLINDKYGRIMGDESDYENYHQGRTDESVILLNNKNINDYRKNFFLSFVSLMKSSISSGACNVHGMSWPIKVCDVMVGDKKEVFGNGAVIFNVNPDMNERPLSYMPEKTTDDSSELSCRVIDVAEHDILIKLSRLTGLDVVVVDLDKASSECVRYGYENVLEKIRGKIVSNKNSILFFRKKSMFSYNRIQKKIFNEMLGDIGRLGDKGNYLIITNQKGYNDQKFKEYNFIDGKLSIDEK